MEKYTNIKQLQRFRKNKIGCLFFYFHIHCWFCPMKPLAHRNLLLTVPQPFRTLQFWVILSLLSLWPLWPLRIIWISFGQKRSTILSTNYTTVYPLTRPKSFLNKNRLPTPPIWLSNASNLDLPQTLVPARWLWEGPSGGMNPLIAVTNPSSKVG